MKALLLKAARDGTKPEKMADNLGGKMAKPSFIISLISPSIKSGNFFPFGFLDWES